MTSLAAHSARLGELSDAQVGAMLDDVALALAQEWPQHAAFIRRHHGEVTAAARIALLRVMCSALAAGTTMVTTPDLALTQFEEIGRAQFRAGAGLNRLLTAYHVGARTVWRHMAGHAHCQGIDADGVAALAESLFGLVGEIAQASARGFIDAQSRAAVEQERARAELVDLLLGGCPSSVLRAAAARAHWPLPETATIVLLARPYEEFLPERRWLPIRRADLTGVLVPNPEPLDRRGLLAAVRDRGAVIGATVGLAELPEALRVARVISRLAASRAVAGEPLFVSEHLDAAIVHADTGLLDALRAQVLAPFADLPEELRDRLTETLRCWLRCFGDRRAMAAALYVHPQTVRYRLRQLEELFGPALTDPAERLKLTLALAWSPD